jgi:hypothetical protein
MAKAKEIYAKPDCFYWFDSIATCSVSSKFPFIPLMQVVCRALSCKVNFTLLAVPMHFELGISELFFFIQIDWGATKYIVFLLKSHWQ